MHRLNKDLAYFAEIKRHREESAVVLIAYKFKKLLREKRAREVRHIKERIAEVEFNRKVMLIKKTWKMCKFKMSQFY